MSDAIVACARGWLGTRFQHQGRVKKASTHKGGVDCLGLLIGVAKELHLTARDGQLLAAADETGYSHSPDTLRLQSRLTALLEPIPVSRIMPGNILLLRIESSPQHMAISSDRADRLGMIHAYAPARAVVEHALDGWWMERIEAAFHVYNT